MRPSVSTINTKYWQLYRQAVVHTGTDFIACYFFRHLRRNLYLSLSLPLSGSKLPRRRKYIPPLLYCAPENQSGYSSIPGVGKLLLLMTFHMFLLQALKSESSNIRDAWYLLSV